MSRGPHQLITPAGGKREEEEERHIVVMFFIFSACSEEFIESSRFNQTLLPLLFIFKCLSYVLKYRMSFNILTYRTRIFTYVTLTAQHFLILKTFIYKNHYY